MNFSQNPVSYLFSHHLLCLRFRTLVAYLCRVKFTGGTDEDHPLATFLPFWQWPRRFWLEKAVQYGFLAAITLEGLYVSLIAQDDKERSEMINSQYLPYHPLILFTMANFSFFSATVLRCTCLMAVFAAVVDLSLYFRLDASILRAVHELIVINGRHFRQLNGKLVGTSTSDQLREVLLFWYRAVRRRIWTNPGVRLYKHLLEGFPALSTTVRTRMVLFSAAVEVVIFIANCVLYIIIAAIFAAFLVLLFTHRQLPTSVATLAAAELVPVLFNTSTVIRQLFLSMQALSLVAFLSNHLCVDMTTKSRQLVEGKLRQQKELTRLELSQLHRLMHFLQGQFWATLALSRHVDQQVVSGLMFTTFATNITLNLVMVGSLLFKEISFGEQLVMLAITSLQLGLTVFGCVGLIRWSSAFYPPTMHLLYSAQFLLLNRVERKQVQRQQLVNNNWRVMIVTKLRLLSFTEMACSTEQFRFRMGNLGKITQQSLFEFALFYTGMVMYVAKMVRKDRV